MGLHDGEHLIPVTAGHELDTRWAAEVAEFCAESYAQYAAMAPGTASQVDSVLAAECALDCASVLHALGAPAHDVHLWIVRAASALTEVFRLRGTTPAIPVVGIRDAGTRELSVPAEPDQSLTNSRRGLVAMYAALVTGDPELVKLTASLVGDSPDASSSACSRDEQRLAHAVNALVVGDAEVAQSRAAAVDSDADTIRAQAAAVQAIAARSSRSFIDALGALLEAHRAEAVDPRHRREPRYLLSLPGLALATLATGSEVARKRQLPVGYAYFPVELVARVR